MTIEKTQTELELARAQALVEKLQAKATAESALAADVGPEERALAMYLHTKCCTDSRALCAMCRQVRTTPAGIDFDWGTDAAKSWLARATTLVADLPGLGWTIS